MTDDKPDPDTIEEVGEALIAQHGERCGLHHVGHAMVGAANKIRATSGGPAQVATDAYRQNWDTIFGGRVAVGQA